MLTRLEINVRLSDTLFVGCANIPSNSHAQRMERAVYLVLMADIV
jgi:hypothetical protein